MNEKVISTIDRFAVRHSEINPAIAANLPASTNSACLKLMNLFLPTVVDLSLNDYAMCCVECKAWDDLRFWATYP